MRNNKSLQRMIDRNVATVEAREAWAVAHALSYAIQDPLGLDTLPLAAPSVGSGHTSYSVVSGHWKGVPVVAWDLTYWHFFAMPAYLAMRAFTSQRQFDLSCGMVLLPRACPRVILVPSKRGAAFARKAARSAGWRASRCRNLSATIGRSIRRTIGSGSWSREVRFNIACASTSASAWRSPRMRWSSTEPEPIQRSLGYLLDTVVNLRNHILPAVDLLPVRGP